MTIFDWNEKVFMMLDVLNHVPQRKAPIIYSSCGHATGIIAGVMWIRIFIKDVDKEKSEGFEKSWELLGDYWHGGCGCQVVQCSRLNHHAPDSARKNTFFKLDWVVVWNICYFHPYLGKWSNLTNIFQMGWNHQPVEIWMIFFQPVFLIFLGGPVFFWNEPYLADVSLEKSHRKLKLPQLTG